MLDIETVVQIVEKIYDKVKEVKGNKAQLTLLHQRITAIKEHAQQLDKIGLALPDELETHLDTVLSLVEKLANTGAVKKALKSNKLENQFDEIFGCLSKGVGTFTLKENAAVLKIVNNKQARSEALAEDAQSLQAEQDVTHHKSDDILGVIQTKTSHQEAKIKLIAPPQASTLVSRTTEISTTTPQDASSGHAKAIAVRKIREIKAEGEVIIHPGLLEIFCDIPKKTEVRSTGLYVVGDIHPGCKLFIFSKQALLSKTKPSEAFTSHLTDSGGSFSISAVGPGGVVKKGGRASVSNISVGYGYGYGSGGNHSISAVGPGAVVEGEVSVSVRTGYGNKVGSRSDFNKDEPRFSVKGSLLGKVTINTDLPAEIEGDIGPGSEIISCARVNDNETAITVLGNVIGTKSEELKPTKLLADGAIIAGHIKGNSSVMSKDSTIVVSSVAAESTVWALKDVTVKYTIEQGACVRSDHSQVNELKCPRLEKPQASTESQAVDIDDESTLEKRLAALLMPAPQQLGDKKPVAAAVEEDDKDFVWALALSASQEESSSYSSSPSVVMFPPQKTKGMSSKLEDYLKPFENKLSNTEYCDLAGISSPSKLGLSHIKDTLTSKLPDIPVWLKGELYDFRELLKLDKDSEGNRTIPKTGIQFNLFDVEPAPTMQQQIDEAINAHQESIEQAVKPAAS